MIDEILTSGDVADLVCQAVAELPDRNSPEGQPEMMLVTGRELRAIVLDAITAWADAGATRPTYRLLEWTDRIQADDEFIGDDTVTWHKPVGWEIGAQYGAAFMPARRKVNPTPLPGRPCRQ